MVRFLLFSENISSREQELSSENKRKRTIPYRTGGNFPEWILVFNSAGRKDNETTIIYLLGYLYCNDISSNVVMQLYKKHNKHMHNTIILHNIIPINLSIFSDLLLLSFTLYFPGAFEISQ